MEIEDMGNAVKIGKKIIPAWNRQIEGFPRRIDDEEYGIYFEIPFETGMLWMIEAFSEDAIAVTEYQFLGHSDDLSTRDYSEPLKTWVVHSWDEFLNEYESYLNETLRAA